MADDLSAELDLSIEKALSSVDELRNQIDRATQESADQFQNDFAQAVSGVPDVQIVANTDDVEPAITTAIGDTDSTVLLDPDAAAVAPAIDDAVASADSTVAVDADTSAAVTEMAAAGEGVTATMAVDADTAPALAAIDDVVTQASGQSVDLSINVDTSQAVQSTDDLSSSSDDATTSMDAASVAGQGLGAATSVSSGSIDTFTNAVGSALGGMGPWGAALAGSVVALGSFTNSAVNSLGAVQRLGNTFGEFQGQIEHIQVGNLDTSLKQLALDTGSSGSAMRNAASDSFQMVSSFGVGAPAAAKYAAEVQSLAARAVALNPELGETGAVAGRLEAALRSGRDKALVPFNLGLTQQQISAKAAQIALADHRTEVTAADKAMAGASLATAALGGHLKQDIAEGAKDPILQVRTLAAEFKTATTEIGKPLVAPTLEGLRAALPSVTAIGQSIGVLAQAALPLLAAGLALVAKPLQAFADGLSVLGPVGFAGVTAAVLVVAGALGVLDGAIGVTIGFVEALTASMVENPFFLIAATIGVAVAALGIFGGASKDAKASTQELTDAITAQNGAIDASALDVINKELGDLKENFTQSGVNAKAYGTALESVVGATKSQRDAIRDLADSYTSDAKVTEAGIQTHQEWLDKLHEISPALADVATKLERHGQLSAEVRGKILDQALATAEAGKAANDAAAFEIKQAEALDFTKEANDAALKAAKDHKEALYEQMAATQDATLATQAQAQVDALATTQAQQLALAHRSIHDGQVALNTETATSSAAFDAASAASGRYAFGVGSAKEMTDALSTASGILNDQLDRLLGRFTSADESTNSFKQGLLDLNATLFTNGGAFDDTTKAGLADRDALDQLADKASAAGKAIFNSTGDVAKAKAPLEEFRGTLQKLHDDLAAQNKDTSFVDNLLHNVDVAIAGVGAKAPEAQQSGWVVGNAYGTGVTSTWAGAEAAGAGLGSASNRGAASWSNGHFLTGWGSGAQHNAGVTAQQPGALTAGWGLGSNSKQGAGSWAGLHFDAGAAAGSSFSTGISTALQPSHDAGWGLGDQAHTGASGWDLTPLGSSLGAGFAAGIGGADTAVRIAAAGIAATAMQTVHDFIGNPPFPSREGLRLGRSLGYGFAVGIDSQGDVAAANAQGIASAATAGLAPALNGAGGTQGRAYSPFTPNFAGGAGNQMIQFNINVSGVTSPTMARTVGEQVGAGAVDALTRRGIVTTARLG